MTTRRLLALLLLVSSCDAGDDVEASCADGRCDVSDTKIPISPCDDALIDRSGRTNPDGTPIKRVAGRLGDPIAKLVYMTPGGCPTSFADIMAKLAKTDGKKCDEQVGLGGMTTHVVSESAELDGNQDGLYRAVTTRACGDREQHEMIFSQFGLDPKNGAFPDGVEIVAFDRKAGVFDYYKEVDGKMAFFGTSMDFVTQKPGGPGVTDVRGCGNCHTGGGLIMKELTSPWMHWEGGTGTGELIDQRPLLGTQAFGPDMEGVTRSGNVAWNTTRIKAMKKSGTVADLLRPLFCPVEVNLANGGSSSLPSEQFVDQQLGRVSMPLFGDDVTGAEFTRLQAAYQAAIAANRQQVPGHPGKLDTAATFGFVTQSGADQAYVQQLLDAGIVDPAFVRDVLMVDYTRPVFSDTRCDLLKFAPTLKAVDRTPEKIRAGFVAMLANGAGGPAGGQLRAFLSARDPRFPVLHAFTLKRFADACVARTSTTMLGGLAVRDSLLDALKLRSLGRKTVFRDGELDGLKGSAAHPRPVFEFADTLATDALVVNPEARLSPTTCQMIERFEAVPPPAIENFGACESEFSSGICVDTSEVTCPQETESGLCPGAASIRCCPLEFIGEAG